MNKTGPDKTIPVSVIIPHWNGVDILDACLKSLMASTYPDLEIIVVDNASTDDSVAFIRREYPTVQVIENSSNLGFAGGCNKGLRKASGNYCLILNNDTTHEPGWIEELVDVMDADPAIAAVQPKIMSAGSPELYDYSGAVGGMMDVLGFPYALGRIFTTMEKDDGEYDTPQEIFWASGTAFLLRRAAIDEVGTLDEDFFAHMEEIDLCWRLQNAGWTIKNAPKSKIYHHSGWTLPPDRYLKKYLNHRNNLIMLTKNYPFAILAFVLPARLALEGVAFVFSAFIMDWKRMGAVVMALLWNLFHPWLLLRKHMQVRRTRKPGAVKRTMGRMYGGSIFFQYFLLGRKKVKDIKGAR